DRLTGGGVDLDDHVVVAEVRAHGRVAADEGHIDAAVGRHCGSGELIEDLRSGDLRRGRPGLTTVVRDCGEDGRADVAALLALVELRIGDDGVAVAPGGDVGLVVEGANAAYAAGAFRHHLQVGPRLAAVRGGGHADVTVGERRTALPLDVAQEAEVGLPAGVAGHARVARPVVAGGRQGVGTPGHAAVEGDAGPGDDALQE